MVRSGAGPQSAQRLFLPQRHKIYAEVALLVKHLPHSAGDLAPDRPDNLFEPVHEDAGAHGRFDTRARASSTMLWMLMHQERNKHNVYGSQWSTLLLKLRAVSISVRIHVMKTSQWAFSVR